MNQPSALSPQPFPSPVSPDSYRRRHIGPDEAERDAMLATVGVPSLDALIDEAIPAAIRLRVPLDIPSGQSGHRYLRDLHQLADRNQVFRSYIGLGYYDCVTPSVIQRNVLENPGWYTPYTPYQAEIAQGRLEALLTFQTMVADLTGMEIANASLLDEATAAAEAMTMIHRVQSKRIEQAAGPAQFFVAASCFPQTIEVLRARAEPLGIELVVGDEASVEFTGAMFGALVQTPDEAGRVHDYSAFAARAKEAGVLVAVATDLLALTLLRPRANGTWTSSSAARSASASRWDMAVPRGVFATRHQPVRERPGRVVGGAVDDHGNPAYRMAVQRREQHIGGEKVTSNI